MELGLDVRTEGSLSILSVSGEVDIATSSALREALVGAIDKGSSVVIVDLLHVGFLDSSGLGVLVSGLKRAKERGGDLLLVSSSEDVLKVLRITGLTKVFSIHGTVSEAASKARAHRPADS